MAIGKNSGEEVREDSDEDTKPPKGAATDNESPYSIAYWKSQIKYAKKAAKASRTAADDAWREYISSFEIEPTMKSHKRVQATRFPIYWSSVRSIQPFLYSRTPTVISMPMLDTINDKLADLCCECVERLGKYLLHRQPFDRIMYAVRDDFIHAGKACPRVIYEATTTTETEKIRIFPKMESQPVPPAPPMPGQPPADPNQPPQMQEVQVGWMDDLGKDIAFDGEPMVDEEGLYIEQVTECLEDEKLEAIPCSYKDILHTPHARSEDEVTWKAYYSQLTRHDVKNLFGEEVAADMPYSKKRRDEDESEAQRESKTTGDKFVGIWEIWSKSDRKVRFLPDGYDGFIVPLGADPDDVDETKAIDDPYELPKFFPSPEFILGTVGPDNMYPTPDYVQLKPFIQQLHALLDRFRRLVRANKVRGVYDASIQELADLAGTTPFDGDYIGINNFQGQIVGKGGLESVVQHFPTDKLTEAISVIQGVIQAYQAQFNELYGIPDILRGVSDPNETAAAQQQKGKYLSLRASAVQREFQRLCRDTLEMLIDLALLKFQDDRLYDIMGYSKKDPEEQAMFPQVLALLRDFDNRLIRVDIETDSTITFNQDADVERRVRLADTLTKGIQAATAAANGDQDILAISLNTLLFVVRGLPNGKTIADDMESVIQKITTRPPPPPPPDPAKTAADASVQVATIKAQADQQIAGIRAQTEAQIAQMKAQSDAQIESLKGQIELTKTQAAGQIDQQSMQADAQLKLLEHQLNQTVAQTDAQIERERAQFDAQLKMIEARFDMQIMQTKAQAEIEKAQLEGQAINAKAEAETVKAAASSQTAQASMPTIHVNLPSSQDKRITPIMGPDGQMIYDVKHI